MRIEIDKTTWSRVEEYARTAGYSSPEEVVRHAIERHLAKSDAPDDENTAAAKIRGIGYIDAGLGI